MTRLEARTRTPAPRATRTSKFGFDRPLPAEESRIGFDWKPLGDGSRDVNGLFAYAQVEGYNNRTRGAAVLDKNVMVLALPSQRLRVTHAFGFFLVHLSFLSIPLSFLHSQPQSLLYRNLQVNAILMDTQWLPRLAQLMQSMICTVFFLSYQIDSTLCLSCMYICNVR